MKLKEMKSKLKIAVLCGIFLTVALVIGGVVFAWKSTFGKKKTDDASSVSTMTESVSEDSVDSSTSSETTPGISSELITGTEESTGETSAPDATPVSPKKIGTIQGTGYEGTQGTGKYNYGEALQKSLLFYELQRSGKLPSETRSNWRGDSCLKDGSDAGVDLTGGWFDAGDNVKFNLPMAYTASMLGWSICEDKDAYEESKQLDYALANIRWANEYFIKCHVSDEKYFYQVGNGSADHSWWGSGECVEYQMNRPSYFVDGSNPGSAVTGETAASLAVCSILFKDVDPTFSKTCLDHAKSLYAFADKYKSDAGYTQANGFYDSWSGFYDELSWAAVWLYRATGDSAYLNKAKEYYPKANQDFNWALCWDDVHIGAAVLLASETGENTYKQAVEKHLDFWTTGTSSGERITYTPKGLAWLDSWGSLRYATTTGFVAAVYSESDACPSAKKDTYWNFAVNQAGYALGDTGRSFMIGFGENYPQHPHHRTAQGSYCDNMNEPGTSRHVLCGALVGGPDASDGYTDEVSNYNTNEVACDYNAGFTGLLAKLYTRYHGQTLTGFGAGEAVGEEYRVDTTVNAGGADFLEIKALTYNMTGWPARAPKNLELRYYFTIPSGKTISDLSVTSSYGQDVASIQLLAGENNTACVQVIFKEYSCYPGGQEEYKKEVQFRINGLPQDAAGDAKVCLFEDGSLVFGQLPDGSGNVVTPDPTETTESATPTPTPASPVIVGGRGIVIDIEYNMRGTGTAISGNLLIVNQSSEPVDVGSLSVLYYFTNENSTELVFDCYHCAIAGKDGKYEAINGVTGTFAKFDPAKDGVDTTCTISSFGSGQLRGGDQLVVQFSIHHADWTNFNLNNDYSRAGIDRIVILENGKKIYGKEPS